MFISESTESQKECGMVDGAIKLHIHNCGCRIDTSRRLPSMLARPIGTEIVAQRRIGGKPKWFFNFAAGRVIKRLALRRFFAAALNARRAYARIASIAPSSQMLCFRVSGITKSAMRNMIAGSPMGGRLAPSPRCRWTDRPRS